MSTSLKLPISHSISLLCRFSNLGILHVTKKGVGEVLFKRLRDEKRRQRGQHYHFTGKSLKPYFTVLSNEEIYSVRVES